MSGNKENALDGEVLPWQRLVTAGHVWVARLNAIQWIGPMLLVAVVTSIYFDIRAARTGAAQSYGRHKAHRNSQGADHENPTVQDLLPRFQVRYR